MAGWHGKAAEAAAAEQPGASSSGEAASASAHSCASQTWAMLIKRVYDLVADPAEAKDLAAETPEVVKKMAAQLEAWQQSVERSLFGQDYPSPTGRQD